jgi:hypothetical protein
MLQDMGVDENDTIIFLADSIGVVKKHLSTPAAPILFLILHPLVLDRPHSPHRLFMDSYTAMFRPTELGPDLCTLLAPDVSFLCTPAPTGCLLRHRGQKWGQGWHAIRNLRRVRGYDGDIWRRRA